MISVVLRNVVLPALILAGGIGGFAVLYASRTVPESKALGDDRPPPVEVVGAENASPGMLGIEANGTIVPKREVTLSAEVEGRVDERTDACWAGRSVKAGDLLLTLDPRPLEIQKDVAEADLAQVAADLDQLEIEIENTEELVALGEQEVDLSRREQTRVEQLIARNASSASERDVADSKVLTSRQNLQRLRNDQRTFASRRAGLEAQRSRIEAQLDQIAYDLERASVIAPVDGRIVEVLVEKDSYARPGEVLVTIEDTATMEVRCSLRLEDLYWLAGGDDPLTLSDDDPYAIPKARAVVSRSLGGRVTSWEGVLSRFEGTGIDERTRTVPCRVEVPAPAGLRRGMFVSLSLFGEEAKVPLISIPRNAFRPNNVVWIASADDSSTESQGSTEERLDRRLLEILRVEPVRVLTDTVLIRGDGPDGPIPVGAELIVSQLNDPQPGMAIRVGGLNRPDASTGPEDDRAIATSAPGADLR